MLSSYAYRSMSIVTPAARRVFHSTTKSLKASIPSTESAASSSSSSSSSTASKVVAKSAANSSSATATAAPGSFAKNHPFAFQMIVATSKTMAADLMTQVVAERKSFDEIDWKRNGIFVVFGFCYLGGFQYWLMVNKYRQWFPTMDRFAKLPFAHKLRDTAGLLDAAKMVVFDLAVHMPILYFPTYYTVKECVGGTSWNPVDWVKDGVFTKYAGNFQEDYVAMIKLWGPSDCVQFALPVHIRLPFRHFVSFFWTAYVSFTRGQIEPVPVAPAAAVALEGP